MSRQSAARRLAVTLRVVQASFYRDPDGRTSAELLETWPTLPQVAGAVARAGVDITVVQAHARQEQQSAHGVDIRFTPDVPAAIAELAPDVVHLHGLQFPLSIRELCRRNPELPVLVQDHGGGAPARWRQPLLSLGLSRIRGAMFTAKEQARAYQRVLPKHVQVFEVLESSCAFSPGDRAEARAATGVHGDPAVLWVGRLDRNKDPFTALSAIKLAAQELPGIQLWCCFGDDSLLESVRAKVAGDDLLRTRVHLVGAVPHAMIEQFCRACDFFISTSHSESTGYALLEGLACGLTPVVTDIPSHGAIIHAGEIGALAPIGDAHAMASALIRLAGQPRAALRNKASTHFQKHLTFDVIGTRLRGAYEAVLA
ncbi:MAG: glycosyltransferase family 4 protein [Gemmatimonadota bacterium]